MQNPNRDAQAVGHGAPSTLQALRAGLRLAVQSAIYRITCHLLSHPWLMKVSFALLRRVRPITVVGSLTVVTKASDVREVLERFEDFTLNDVLAEGMPWGPFMMSIDWREQHDRERGLLWSVVQPAVDIEQVRAIAQAAAADLIRHAQQNYAGRGEIDVVAGLAEPVMVRVFAQYLGITAINRDEAEMAITVRRLAALIMVRPPEGSERWRLTRESVDKISEHLRTLIHDRRVMVEAQPNRPAAVAGNGDLLTRLVTLLANGAANAHPAWFNESWIQRYFAGLASTGAATIVRGTTHAFDRLLAHPTAFRRAQKIAQRLHQAEMQLQALSQQPASTPGQRQAAVRQVDELRQRLQQMIYEALRFRPMLSLLVRGCPRETIIAKDTKRARTVSAGARVLVPPLAAMTDPEVFEMPWRYCSARPIEDYMHFGHGPRVCFGKYIADVVLIEIIGALLRLPGLSRAHGSQGRVGYDGPAVGSLWLTFGEDR